MMYSTYNSSPVRKRKKPLRLILLLIVVGILGFVAKNTVFAPQTVEEKIEARLVFDESVTGEEISKITRTISESNISIDSEPIFP